MQPALRTFVERMGLEAERDGMPRISGRILAYLIAQEAPASLDQIAEALQVSRASVSTNCRLLEQFGAAERVSLPGDRKDYYVLTPDFPDRFFDLTQARSERKVQLAEEALAALPGNAGVARDRMRLWRDFHGFILENLETIRARWTERTGGEGEAPSRPSDPSGTPPPSSDQAEPEGGA